MTSQWTLVFLFILAAPQRAVPSESAGGEAPPVRCPPLSKGAPKHTPKFDTLAVGSRTLRVWRCPSEGTQADHDVVHVSIDGLFSRRLVPDDNWLGGPSGSGIPDVGGASVQALGPFAAEHYAIVLRILDYGPGTGSWEVYVVGSDGISEPRSFPGGGEVYLKGGELIALEGALSDFAGAELAVLDRSYRWNPSGWIAHGLVRMRKTFDFWPCEDRSNRAGFSALSLPTRTPTHGPRSSGACCKPS